METTTMPAGERLTQALSAPQDGDTINAKTVELKGEAHLGRPSVELPPETLRQDARIARQHPLEAGARDEQVRH